MLGLRALKPSLSDKMPAGKDLAKRLHAWWEGYYLEHQVEPEPPEKTPQESPEPSREERDNRKAAAWSDPRVQVSEMLWGPGFMTPGGPERVISLIHPLGLDSSMKVFDLGCGLGGSTRTIHTETGAWVTGYEGSPLLAEAAQELSQMAGLTRKAAIEAYDPENVALKANSASAVVSKEAFFSVENKEGLFKGIYDALKVDGQLLFTDYMLVKPNLSSAAVEQWLENEPKTPVPWCVDEARACLTDLGFEVRVTEDVTAEQRRLTLINWGQFVETLTEREYRRGWGPGLLAEVEIWANRINALESGDVGVYRIYARKYDPKLKR